MTLATEALLTELRHLASVGPGDYDYLPFALAIQRDHSRKDWTVLVFHSKSIVGFRKQNISHL